MNKHVDKLSNRSSTKLCQTYALKASYLAGIVQFLDLNYDRLYLEAVWHVMRNKRNVVFVVYPHTLTVIRMMWA
jgi:hypothetical protein